MQSLYDVIPFNAQISDIVDWVRKVTREREIDLQDYNNHITTSVRRYENIPASSSDVIGTEKVGDIAVDTNYIYIAVENSGVIEWQRAQISTF